MDGPDIENQKRAELISLTAQRTAILAALDMHIHRSEELALEAQEIEQEIEQLKQEVQA